MKNTLNKTTRARLAELIGQSSMLGTTHNGLDLYRAALAVTLLNTEFGVRLDCLNRAREILDNLQPSLKG